MTVLKQYCDHCGKELNSMEDYSDTVIDFCTDYLEADLCASCYEEILNITKAFLNRSDNNVNLQKN